MKSKKIKLKIEPGWVLMAIILIVIIVFIKNFISLPDYLNKKICELEKLEIKGVIIDFPETRDSYVTVSNMNNYVPMYFKKTIYNQGFSEEFSYEVGDSIIKKANSNKLTIKRGNKSAIYELDCDE